MCLSRYVALIDRRTLAYSPDDIMPKRTKPTTRRKKLDIKAVRPRGILLADDARTFNDAKQRDDFRLLSQGNKNITVLTYDELLTRLKNYIGVLEDFALSGPEKTKKKSCAKKK